MNIDFLKTLKLNIQIFCQFDKVKSAKRSFASKLSKNIIASLRVFPSLINFFSSDKLYQFFDQFKVNQNCLAKEKREAKLRVVYIFSKF